MYFTVVPNPPQNVTVVSQSSRVVTISWKPGFDGNSDILNYTVKISTDNQTFKPATCQGLSNSTCVVSSSFTSASLTGLHPGRSYYIRVIATNKVGPSAASSVVNTTTDEEGTHNLIKRHARGLTDQFGHKLSILCGIMICINTQLYKANWPLHIAFVRKKSLQN